MPVVHAKNRVAQMPAGKRSRTGIFASTLTTDEKRTCAGRTATIAFGFAGLSLLRFDHSEEPRFDDAPDNTVGPSAQGHREDRRLQRPFPGSIQSRFPDLRSNGFNLRNKFILHLRVHVKMCGDGLSVFHEAEVQPIA